MSLLKAEGLVKVYGRRRVVDGVSFEVPVSYTHLRAHETP